jgi:tripartite-type tricarboxylate transporter receptor subunit TctC
MVIPLAPGDTVDLLEGHRHGNSENPQHASCSVNKAGGRSDRSRLCRKAKDGYTILYANSNIYYAHAMNPENVPYNPLTDLEPICLAISVPLTVPVQTESPWKTFQELVTYMKENPGKVRGSSTGMGSVGHFNFEIIRLETGNAITMIPYKGASPAMTALLGGMWRHPPFPFQSSLLMSRRRNCGCS